VDSEDFEIHHIPSIALQCVGPDDGEYHLQGGLTHLPLFLADDFEVVRGGREDTAGISYGNVATGREGAQNGKHRPS
jgi:hypothetical protein